MAGLAKKYLSGLYHHTMRNAYGLARNEIFAARKPGWKVLDCGAYNGEEFERLNALSPLEKEAYTGLEWSAPHAANGRKLGLDIRQGDLNEPMPFEDETFDCVFGLSVLEHLLMGCSFLREANRVLKPGGKLVLLTPNISTYFTIGLLLLGRMPSTGPHPDSDFLLEKAIAIDVKRGVYDHETGTPYEHETDTPTHRHLVVFSYSALGKFLRSLEFEEVVGKGFGHYPLPNFAQPLLQRIDPWHCHQMVYTAIRKRA